MDRRRRGSARWLPEPPGVATTEADFARNPPKFGGSSCQHARFAGVCAERTLRSNTGGCSPRTTPRRPTAFRPRRLFSPSWISEAWQSRSSFSSGYSGVRPAAPKSRIARYRRPGARDRTRDCACTPRRHRDLRQSRRRHPGGHHASTSGRPGCGSRVSSAVIEAPQDPRGGQQPYAPLSREWSARNG